MWLLTFISCVVCFGGVAITKLIGKDAVNDYLSTACKEIQELDYKIAEALHFIEDGDTIFPNILLYNGKVRNVTKYVDSYYDVFSKYENLVLERGPKRWFPVHFVEDLAEERFNWTKNDFKTLNDLHKQAENVYYFIKNKCKKWQEKNATPISIWQ